jgi:hypothetical protein
MLIANYEAVDKGLLAVAIFTSVSLLNSCSSSSDDKPVDDPQSGLPVIVAEGDILSSVASCPNGGVQLDRRYRTPFSADTIAIIENAYRLEIESASGDNVRFLTDRRSIEEKPDLSMWATVLNEQFNTPVSDDFADLSGALDWRLWNTKCAFSTTLDSTTIPGEESFCNVNTTGRYPGEGPDLPNFDDDIAQIEYLDQLFDSSQWVFNGTRWRVNEDKDRTFPVFHLDTDNPSTESALKITAYRSVGPLPGSVEQRPYVSGLISSHANPDPEKNSTVNSVSGWDYARCVRPAGFHGQTGSAGAQTPNELNTISWSTGTEQSVPRKRDAAKCSQGKTCHR